MTHTHPELLTQVSKAIPVVFPGSKEVNLAIHSSLDNLQTHAHKQPSLTNWTIFNNVLNKLAKF